MSNETNDTHKIVIRRYQCRHVFTDGHRCGSPCLRGANGPEDFCYYHHATRRPKPSTSHDPYNEPPNQTAFTLPIPEDHSSIQHAIGTIMNQLATNALDPRRAGLLLYALQIASGNLAKKPIHSADDIVQEMSLDPLRGPLAPENELPGDASYREFLDSLDEADAEDEENDEEEDHEDEEEDECDEENGTLNFRAAALPTQSHLQKPRRYLAKSCIESTLPKSTPGGQGNRRRPALPLQRVQPPQMRLHQHRRPIAPTPRVPSQPPRPPCSKVLRTCQPSFRSIP